MHLFFYPLTDEGIWNEQCTFAIDTSIDQFERAARVGRESGTVRFAYFYSIMEIMKYESEKTEFIIVCDTTDDKMR